MASLELLLWDKLPRDEWREPPEQSRLREAMGYGGEGSRCPQGTRRVMGGKEGFLHKAGSSLSLKGQGGLGQRRKV